MKKLTILIFVLLFVSSCTVNHFGACTLEAKICDEGSSVARNPKDNCNFNDCPQTITCDYKNQCPAGYNCYLLPEADSPICYTGDPCILCGLLDCDTTESFPMQVICLNEEFCNEMPLSEAIKIAESSECTENYFLTESYSCNNLTKNWIIDIEPNDPGCNPHCYINTDTKLAEINYMCTGLLS